MKAIAEFRGNQHGPVLETLQVNGRGIEHVNRRCTWYASLLQDKYSYWEIRYRMEWPGLDKLMEKRGSVYVRPIVSHDTAPIKWASARVER
tara:strand:- start:764 stop:1036 length:273 start_codon:yes stop_codon:yes gene_type:complete